MVVRSLTLGLAGAVLMVSGAQAADFFVPSTPQQIFSSAPGFSPGFGWEGLYVGLSGGGQFYSGDIGADTQWLLGGHVGVNFIPFDPVLLGLEIQGAYAFESGATSAAWEVLALGRVGVIVTDQLLAYGTGGLGAVTATGGGGGTEGVYALGAGLEFGVTDSISLRGEVLGIGFFDSAVGPNTFDAAKATLGVSFHF